jgi:hypothetical protein
MASDRGDMLRQPRVLQVGPEVRSRAVREEELHLPALPQGIVSALHPTVPLFHYSAIHYSTIPVRMAVNWAAR